MEVFSYVWRCRGPLVSWHASFTFNIYHLGAEVWLKTSLHEQTLALMKLQRNHTWLSHWCNLWKPENIVPGSWMQGVEYHCAMVDNLLNVITICGHLYQLCWNTLGTNKRWLLGLPAALSALHNHQWSQSNYSCYYLLYQLSDVICSLLLRLTITLGIHVFCFLQLV